jgi:hypothetical protein
MKQCTGCGGLFQATEEYYGKKSRAVDGLRSECRQCKRDADAETRNSIPSYLKRTYSNIVRRCSGQSNDPRHAYCAKQGIAVRFRSATHFADYVMNILGVDPRGKACHRIETSGDYEPGNIEFLTREEHDKVHAGTRAALC